jgi:hypothetical protein
MRQFVTIYFTLTISLLFFNSLSFAQISINQLNTSLVENFDSMGPTGTTYIPGWTAIRAAGTGTIGATLTLIVSDGSSTAGGVYNAGTTNTSDRAIGTLASGSTIPSFGARYLNNTGNKISQLIFSGYLEQWRSGSNNTVNEIVTFEYSLDATSLSTGTWIPFTPMNLYEILTSTTTAAAVDGNLPANRSSIGGTVSGISWSNGTEMWIRWTDADNIGSDGLYAIDDFSITALAAEIPHTITSTTGPNGTISPLGVVNLSYGANQQFTITPNTGYHVDSVIVDGVKVDSTTSYTFNNVTVNHTIRAVFAQNILVDGLVAYYPFNGNANDESGNGNNAVENNAMLVTDRFGNAQRAYSFDGVDDHIKVPDAPNFHITNSLTISAWVKLGSQAIDYQNIVSRWYNNGVSAASYVLEIDQNNKKPQFRHVGPTGLVGTTANHDIILNTWTHIVGSYDGNYTRIYIDGKLSTSVPNTGAISNASAPLMIGRHENNSNPFNGAIDDIRIYNRALSESEIDSLNHVGGWLNPGSISGLVFNDMNGNGVKDPTENGISNWKVYIAGERIDSIFTDSEGNYTFYYLETGNYEVSEEHKSGWLQTIPSSSGSYNINISKEDNVTGKDFGNYRPDGLVAYYPFSGNAHDSSGNGNNAIENSAILVADRFGNAQRAYSFNGIYDYIKVPDAPNFHITNSLTISAWVKLGSQTITNQNIVSRWYNNNVEAKSYVLEIKDSSKKLRLVLSPGFEQTTATTGIILNTWTHIVGSYDGNYTRIYLDGKLNTSVPNTGAISNASAPLMIGRHEIYSNPFNGSIDDIRIYNRALSESEIDSLNHVGGWLNPGSISGLVFNDMNGNGVKDLTENGISNWKVYIAGERIDSIFTDSEGNYIFYNLGIGNYTVSEEHKPGWLQTIPSYSGGYNVSLSEGQNVTGKDFGNRSRPIISAFSPSEGFHGIFITISGMNFDPVPSNNIVCFGAVRAEVTAANSTSLTVKVPVGTTYSPITLTINGLTAYSKEPFLVTFPSDGVIDNTSFASKVDFGPGKSVTIADIDGDGKSDLIVANSSGGVVSVFRNISTAGIINSGSFAPKVDFAVGSWPFGVITADIDGDGKLDIAVANQGGNSISVLRNTSTAGNLSFAPKVDFSTGRNPWLLAVGDINGDGKSDIVNTNYDTSTVSVLKNQSSVGNISFAARQDYFVGNNPTGVAVRDFNEDGQPDLAVVVSSLNVVSIFKNVSLPDTILFEPKQDFSTGTNPQNIAVGDLQDDDKPDLAVPNVGGTSISILKNTSLSGTISFDRQDISVGVNPKNVQIADINGDAKPDLVFAGSDNTVSVLKNTGSGGNLSFAPRVSYATNNNPWLAAIGDLDGDGKSDISVANGGSNNISVLRNKIVLTFVNVTIQTNLNGPPFRVDDTTYTNTHSFSWLSGSRHTISADTMYQLPSSPNYIWSNWSDNGSRTHDIYPTSDTVFTATYKPYYYLTMDFGNHGTPPYCWGTPQSGWYPKDTCMEINFLACNIIYPHYFNGWNGQGEGSYSGPLNPAIICMQGDISETTVIGWCSYSATADPSTYGPNGGTGYIKLVTELSTCSWFTSPFLPDWIHIDPSYQYGAGSTNIPIFVDPNPNTISRACYIAIFLGSFYASVGVSITQSAQCLLPWSVTNTGNNHTIIIDTTAYPNISGTNISNGDFIGVFYDSSGTLACGGFQVWTGTDNISISAFGDDPTTPAKDGFAEGEEFKWKIFKCVGHTAYDAKASYVPPGGIISHTNLYTANGISQVASLTGGFVTHTNNIRTGWSIISSYIDPLRTELDSVFKNVNSCVIIAKNGAGKSYIPSIPVNTIGSWMNAEGYQIKMSCLDSLKITGLKVTPESTPINIPLGWSIISYLRDSEMSIVTALSSIVSDIIIVKDQDGKTYIPSIPINTIGNLKPGQGYQIKMSTARSLTYPANTPLVLKTDVAESRKSISNNPEHYLIKNITDNNATLAIPARAVASIMQEGDEIGVFDEQGVLIGSAIYTGDNFSIAVWGDDKATSEQDGILDGQKFTLRIWDKKSDIEKQVTKVSWQVGDGIYETNSISILETIEITDPRATIPTHFELMQNYPNPFNPSTKIYFAIPEETNVKITIYNMLGEVVVELLNRPLNAGYHEVVFNSQQYPTGVYYYRMNAGNYTDNKKMVLIK